MEGVGKLSNPPLLLTLVFPMPMKGVRRGQADWSVLDLKLKEVGHPQL